MDPKASAIPESYSSTPPRLAVGKPDYSDLERAGLIQVFEYTFELGWKLMQDYNREMGYEVRSPRESIQQAVLSELLNEFDGYEWLDALKNRTGPDRSRRKAGDRFARAFRAGRRQPHAVLLRCAGTHCPIKA